MAGQKRAQDEPGRELSGLAQISDELTGAGIIAMARAFGRDHDVGALAGIAGDALGAFGRKPGAGGDERRQRPRCRFDQRASQRRR